MINQTKIPSLNHNENMYDSQTHGHRQRKNYIKSILGVFSIFVHYCGNLCIIQDAFVSYFEVFLGLQHSEFIDINPEKKYFPRRNTQAF